MCEKDRLTVVDHFHVVSCTVLSDPITAGLAVDLSRGGLENLLDVRPRGGRTTGHERGAVAGALLTARNTGADEEKALGLELLRAADRVGVVGVTTVNDDIALLKERHELVNESIDGGTSLDEEDNLARALELRDKLLDRVRALDVGACRRQNRKSARTYADADRVHTDPWPRWQGKHQPWTSCGCTRRQ